MALTRDNPRKFDVSDFSAITAGTAIYEGAVVGVVKTTGLAIGGTFDPALHRFAGFAKRIAVIGSRVTLEPKGRIILTVAGATDASANAVVYASDDDTFNLTGSGISVGRVAWHQGGTVCVVEFDAAIDMDGGLRRDSAGNSVLSDAGGVIPTYAVTLGRGTNLLRTALGNATDATESTLASIIIPGGLLGSDGSLEILITATATVSTPDKPIVIYIAGQSLSAPTMLAANTRVTLLSIANMAGSNQTMESLNPGFNPFTQATGAILSRSIDMTVDQTLTITQKWSAAAVAGNTFRIMSYTVLAYPGTIA